MNFSKLIFTFCFLWSGLFIQAQDDVLKTSYVLGGNANFLIQNNNYPFSTLGFNSGLGGIYSSNSNETSNVLFSLNSYIGKELNKHWTAGLLVGYGRSHYEAKNVLYFGQTNTYDLDRIANQMSIGVFSRYSMFPDKKLNLFFQPRVSYNWQSEIEKRDAVETQEEIISFLDIGVSLGVYYKISEHWNVLLQFGNMRYVDGNWEIKDSAEGNNFNSFETNFNLSSVRFGVELKF